MGLSPFKGKPSGDQAVILGPHNDRVNSSLDKDRNVPC